MNNQQKQTMPKQEQTHQPGVETKMNPEPESIKSSYQGSGKLDGKVAIVTGGDSGIGKSAAIHFAKEGADVAICYLEEDNDAETTKQLIEQEGRKCLLIRGDLGQENHCINVVNQVINEFGKIDVLVNNAAEQHPQKSLLDITEAQLDKTFRTNIYAYFFLTKAVLPHLKTGASIINTASITAYAGSPELLDYSSTKGAIVSFTRSLAKSLASQGIRVNGVAPGPIWTPLIPATFDAEKVSKFGGTQPLGRPGQPSELGPGYVYLASDDSSYVTGQMLHINGGEVING
ncbi:SDR family oxidoreductase [Lederbergia citrea]|uniref:SDR family oxidoreductase n=1 Tax=Lederbergia citrea TaxID=2833581 RepID=A0A942UIL1_9BACI|nr:SDR family oxidoreductase [Lederbergia citrea]MBS4177422.1 SDR family oxidoreductase [Lederbergia citrea]MBS4204100.1 SDR family oxidoreductase [Lederbergia citrea]MBS4221315.1 SDR family oxidoreductase [Lederbergia citrea]